jgi:tRNA A-37 threonylcarbamoyl transferase component Bud32
MQAVHAEMAELMGRIGEAVATLHDGGLIHGDLTTSNMLVRDSDGALVCAQVIAMAACQHHELLHFQRWCA